MPSKHKDLTEIDAIKAKIAHFLIEIVTSELYSGVRHNSYAICTIPPHESSPAFLLPHLHEAFPNGKLVFFTSSALDLKEDLKPF
jgi:hypothetical protein